MKSASWRPYEPTIGPRKWGSAEMDDIGHLLATYRGEVDTAARSFYVWKYINDIARTERTIYDELTENALTWNTITHSLATTVYTVLGRIFDNDKNGRSVTACGFVTKCQQNISQFTKPAFESRRLAIGGGERPAYLDEYLQDMYEPVPADFETLLTAVRKAKALYETNYKVIRNKVIAHKDVSSTELEHAWFANTNVDEVETFLKSLHAVGAVVSQWYDNGLKTELTHHQLTEKDYVHKDVVGLISKLALSDAGPSNAGSLKTGDRIDMARSELPTAL